MNVTDKDFYLIVADEKEDVVGFANYLENQAYEKIKNYNVVIDILKYEELSLKQLLAFLNLSNKHRLSKKSFVLVNNAINMDKVPEELILVPTLLEAGDIIQMEEIERDLGAFDDF